VIRRDRNGPHGNDSMNDEAKKLSQDGGKVEVTETYYVDSSSLHANLVRPSCTHQRCVLNLDPWNTFFTCDINKAGGTRVVIPTGEVRQRWINSWKKRRCTLALRPLHDGR
jgi:hypothetical protein